MSRPLVPYKTCPTCEAQGSIFLMYPPYVKLDGTTGSGRIPAFCNNTTCDQRYWYYPRAAYVTLRNVGVKYKDWRLARVDLDTVNTVRLAEGWPLLQEAAGPPYPPKPERIPGPWEFDKEGPEPIPMVVHQIFGERAVYGWWRRLRAAIGSLKSYLPIRGKTNG